MHRPLLVQHGHCGCPHQNLHLVQNIAIAVWLFRQRCCWRGNRGRESWWERREGEEIIGNLWGLPFQKHRHAEHWERKVSDEKKNRRAMHQTWQEPPTQLGLESPQKGVGGRCHWVWRLGPPPQPLLGGDSR